MGTVTDRTGAPLAFAMVTTTGVDTGRMLPAATGMDGMYRFNLPPGNYRMSFEYPGYKVVENSAATINGPWRVVQNCTLEADAQTQGNTTPNPLRNRHRALPTTHRSHRWRILELLRLRPRAMPKPRRSWTNVRTCSRSINGSA